MPNRSLFPIVLMFKILVMFVTKCVHTISYLGEVTSGGPSPSLNCNIAMGYVSTDHAKLNTELLVAVRKKQFAVKVCKLPFVPLKYYTK